MHDAAYDGLDEPGLERRLDLPMVVIQRQTASTMDDAHTLASKGAAAGTLVIAHQQSAGRGRSGGSWVGVEGKSILCTLIERPSDQDTVAVLSLRVGLALATAFDPFADQPVQLKWPNDLLANGGKVGGILIEARWRDQRPEWVAVAAGVNVGVAPSAPGAAALNDDAGRLAVLDAMIPAMRAASAKRGALSPAELVAWRARDWLTGKRVSAPVRGTVTGVLATGELVIETADGPAAVRSGSITLETPESP